MVHHIVWLMPMPYPCWFACQRQAIHYYNHYYYYRHYAINAIRLFSCHAYWFHAIPLPLMSFSLNYVRRPVSVPPCHCRVRRLSARARPVHVRLVRHSFVLSSAISMLRSCYSCRAMSKNMSGFMAVMVACYMLMLPYVQSGPLVQNHWLIAAFAVRPYMSMLITLSAMLLLRPYAGYVAMLHTRKEVLYSSVHAVRHYAMPCPSMSITLLRCYCLFWLLFRFRHCPRYYEHAMAWFRSAQRAMLRDERYISARPVATNVYYRRLSVHAYDMSILPCHVQFIVCH